MIKNCLIELIVVETIVIVFKKNQRNIGVNSISAIINEFNRAKNS